MNKRDGLTHSYIDSIQFIHTWIQPQKEEQKTSKPWGVKIAELFWSDSEA